jgi:large subunit ribosomal protein L14
MIQTESILNVVDNSGAKEVRCIRILRKQGRGFGYLGDTIVGSVQNLKKNIITKVKKKQIVYGIIVQSKKKHKDFSGNYSKFNKNSVILLNETNKLIGTRNTSIFSSALKKTKQIKPFLVKVKLY